MVQTNILEKKIIDSGITNTFISKKLGITTRTFDNKKHNVTKFRAAEITVLQYLLRLNDTEVDDIFFANEVET